MDFSFLCAIFPYKIEFILFVSLIFKTNMEALLLKIQNLEITVDEQRAELDELKTVLRKHRISKCHKCFEYAGSICLCKTCQQQLCEPCQFQCNDCGNFYCQECYYKAGHFKQCGSCQSNICMLDGCSECGQCLCETCRVYCNECGQTLCEKCINWCCVRVLNKCRNCHYNHCAVCWRTEDWKLLSPGRQKNILMLLLVFSRLKHQIKVPPNFVRHIIFRYVILNMRFGPRRLIIV